MSSRHGPPRDRSWERGDRDGRGRGGYSRSDDRARRRGSRSRSRSPRRGERDRQDRDYGTYRGRDRDDRRDREKREPPRRDESRRDHGKDDRREGPPGRNRAKGHDRDHDWDRTRNSDRRGVEGDRNSRIPTSSAPGPSDHVESAAQPFGREEGEEMDQDAQEEDENAAMMAMMGMGGFGSTKNKQVEGNQSGAVDVKKPRTWRQYMNRRGGFNRPLDKIK